MTASTATTPEAYIAELPPERAAVVAYVRDLVNRNLPDGYREVMAFGMICWGIPLSRFPDTYNGQPLGYVSLAAQKNHYALYLNGAYMSEARTDALKAGYADAGKKMDMGKSCLRFKGIGDLAEEAVAASIASTPPDQLIAEYRTIRAATKQGR